MTSPYFEYNKPKVIQALRYHFISRREIKVMMIMVNVFAILAAGLYFWKKISPAAFLMSSFLWILMMLVFWLILPQLVYRRSATFKNRYKVTISENGFTLESGEAYKTWEWSAFDSWMESPHFFHLYFNPRSFFIIPKEIFQSEEEIKARKQFKNFIQSKK